MPKHLRRESKRLKVRAFEKGARNEEQNSALEEEWSALTEGYGVDWTSQIKVKVAEISTGIQSLNNALCMSLEERAKRFVPFLIQSRDKAIAAIHRKFDRLAEVLRSKKEQLVNAFVILYAETQKHGSKLPAKRKFADTPAALFLSFLLISGIETAISIGPMDALGIPWSALSGLICFILSCAIGLFCHLSGEAQANDNPANAFQFGLIALMFTSFLIVLRYVAPEQIDFGIQTLLAFLNLVTLAGGLALAGRVNRYQNYFMACDLVMALPKEIAKIEKSITEKDLELENVNREYNALAYQEAVKQEDDLRSRLNGLTSALSKTKTEYEGKLDLVIQWKAQGIATLKASFNDGKNQRIAFYP